MLVAILSMSSAFGLFLTFNYKSFGFTYITNDKYISVIGSIANFFGACFRIFWGVWFDKYSFQTITTTINVCLLFCCLVVDYAVESEFTYLIIIILVYSSFGGNYSIYPPQNVRMLGKALGSRVYFVTNAGFSIGIYGLTKGQSSSTSPLSHWWSDTGGTATHTAS
jgi:nitrate/nitrite transporter NarK